VWPVEDPPSRAIDAAPAAQWKPTFSPNGATIAAGGDDGVVRVWDVASAKATLLRGHHGRVRLVAFSPDGKSLASAGEDKTTRIWNLASGEGRLVRTSVAEPLRLAFSSRGALAIAEGYEALAVVGADGALACEIRALDIGAIAFAPSGDDLAFESGTEVRM